MENCIDVVTTYIATVADIESNQWKSSKCHSILKNDHGFWLFSSEYFGRKISLFLFSRNLYTACLILFLAFCCPLRLFIS